MTSCEGVSGVLPLALSTTRGYPITGIPFPCDRGSLSLSPQGLRAGCANSLQSLLPMTSELESPSSLDWGNSFMPRYHYEGCSR